MVKKRVKFVQESEFACQYSSKRCDRTRSAKKNGQLHRLCEYHRNRANRFQNEYKQRALKNKEIGTTLQDFEPIPFASVCTTTWDLMDFKILCDAVSV